MKERWWTEPIIKTTAYKNQRKMNKNDYKNDWLEQCNKDDNPNRL